MSRIGEMKGSLFETLDRITDLLILNMIFLLFSIPVITMGASFSALYYTVNKVNRHGRGYMWREFWSAFRKNFRQATLTWLIFLAAGLVLAGDLYFVMKSEGGNLLLAALNVFFLLLAVLLVILAGYVFPYISRFQDTIRVTLKNCVLISIMNVPNSLLVLLLLAGGAAVIYLFFPLAVIVPAAVTNWQAGVLEKVFRKYMQEEDKALEDERNQEWPDHVEA